MMEIQRQQGSTPGRVRSDAHRLERNWVEVLERVRSSEITRPPSRKTARTQDRTIAILVQSAEAREDLAQEVDVVASEADVDELEPDP